MLSALKAFPFEAKQTFWAKKEEGWKDLSVQQCMNKFTSLLSKPCPDEDEKDGGPGSENQEPPRREIQNNWNQ